MCLLLTLAKVQWSINFTVRCNAHESSIYHNQLTAIRVKTLKNTLLETPSKFLISQSTDINEEKLRPAE